MPSVPVDPVSRTMWDLGTVWDFVRGGTLDMSI